VFQLLETLIAEAQKDGQVRTDISARQLAFHVQSVYQGAVMGSVAGYCTVEPVVEAGWSFILDGVRGGLAPAE